MCVDFLDQQGDFKVEYLSNRIDAPDQKWVG